MKKKKIISIIGIIISILGTFIIWHDSQKTISAITNLLKETVSTIGFWQDNPIEQLKIDKFNDALQKASKLDFKGFILLMIGFLLQLITYFDFSKMKKYFTISFKNLNVTVKTSTKNE